MRRVKARGCSLSPAGCSRGTAAGWWYSQIHGRRGYEEVREREQTGVGRMRLAQKSVAAGTCGQSQQCLGLGNCALVKTWKETESVVPTACDG